MKLPLISKWNMLLNKYKAGFEALRSILLTHVTNCELDVFQGASLEM